MVRMLFKMPQNREIEEFAKRVFVIGTAYVRTCV